MKIRLSTLRDGINEWREQLSPSDAGVENPAVVEPLTLDLKVDKRPTKINVTVGVSTNGHFECDRCCEEFIQTINGSCTMLFVQRESPFPDEEPGDPMRSFFPGQTELEITHEIRDTVLLELPMRHLCTPDCKGLCSRCGANLNFEKCRCAQS